MPLGRAADRALFAAAGVATLVAWGAACGGGERSAPGLRPISRTLLATDAERAGEAVYRRERCARCHTIGAAPDRGDLPGGPPPGGWDTRAGPDLGLEGHRRSDDWHLAHLYAPVAVERGSRMPAYRHLFRARSGRPAPTPEGEQLVAFLQALGRGQQDRWAAWRRQEPDIPAPPRADAALLAAGERLYRRLCAACHGGAGDGRGEGAPLLEYPPRDFVAGHYRFKSTPPSEPPADRDLFRMITLGTGAGSGMPGFHWLPAEDRWALVLRLKQFSPALGSGGLRLEGRPSPGIPGGSASGSRSRADGAQAARGRRLWDDLGCAACHGADGRGRAPDRPDAWRDQAGAAVPRAGDLTHACRLRGGASDEAIERAIVLGVGAVMPAFGESLPDAGDRRALLAYLATLRGD